MRKTLIEENEFCVGIFIGGMDGIIDEYEMFIKAHAQALGSTLQKYWWRSENFI
ncbi:MAG: hypothetical protein U5L72_13485 [Bacteroidales bacterium]|nr:hypothetical protein [Bacteroidales bacterium]